MPQNLLPGVCQWNQVWESTLFYSPFSAVFGVLPLQDSLCIADVMIVRVPHYIHVVPRCVNMFTAITMHICHICELTVIWESLTFLEPQLASGVLL